SEAVLGAARDRNYTLLTIPTVEIERDDDLPPGDLRVSCALVDASGEEVSPDAKALGAVESGHTMVLDREKLLREKPRAPKAAITVREGDDRRDIVLGAEPLAIGRDPQNDITLDDRRGCQRGPPEWPRASCRPAHGARGVPRRRPASASRGERAWPRRRERHRDQRRGRLREARARRVRRRRMVGRRRRQHERDRR